jgi:hypothetical protein
MRTIEWKGNFKFMDDPSSKRTQVQRTEKICRGEEQKKIKGAAHRNIILWSSVLE